MNYEYPILQGVEILPTELKIARAKNFALAIHQHPYCIDDSIAYRRTASNNEIIFFAIDIEIPQNPLNGINVYEEIAIVCSESDDNFPEIYALRKDFQQGLPHTNLRPFEHPISLCVTEQTYTEVRHKFNEFEFIELIFRWFTQTAQGKLHQDDQPLEPFFFSRGSVLIPKLYDPQKFTYLNRIEDSDLYELSNVYNSQSSYSILYFQSDPQTHGFIRRQPSKLVDIQDVIRIKGIPFPSFFQTFLNEQISQYINNSSLLKNKLAFTFQIPTKSHENDALTSYFEYLFIFTDSSILEMGEKSGCLFQEDGYVLQIFEKGFDLDLINNIPIALYTWMLDFDPNTAALYNNIKKNENSFILIGAGALGSQVFDQFVRMGFGTWTIIDNDNLYPHNLAKHSLDRKSVGSNKAIKICEKANELHRMEIAKPIISNFLSILKGDPVLKMFHNAKVIIDMSTSIAVGRKLARDFNEEIKAPRISSFLNPNGTDLIILAEDKRRKYRLDFLEMQYYRCLFREELLHNHLKFENTIKVRYNRNSCREITNRTNQTDVALNAAICAKALISIIENGKPTISIWRINEITFEVQKFTFEPTKWVRKDAGEWKIYIDKWLIERMECARFTKLPKETGGILVGSFDLLRKIIYVCDSIFAPPDSIENMSSFKRGVKGLIEEYTNYIQATDYQLSYIGEWHSHPEGHSTRPSSYDIELYEYLYKRMAKQGLPVIMGILGDKDCNIIFKQ